MVFSYKKIVDKIVRHDRMATSYPFGTTQRRTTMTKFKVGQDEDLHKKAATAANNRRSERVRKQEKIKRATQIAMDILHEDANEINATWVKPEPTPVKSSDEIKAEEAAMWGDKPKAPRPARKGNSGMKIMTGDGSKYPSLNAALRALNPDEWSDENDYRRSCWTKINRRLKKLGECTFDGYDFYLITWVEPK